jgi:CheY-like chemotaxis protein
VARAQRAGWRALSFFPKTPSVLRVLHYYFQRADPVTADIPVVFLTAKAMPDELQRLLRLGVRGVLNKPFDPMTLPAQLKLVLAEGAR